MEMPCVSPDGKLTSTGMMKLRLLKSGALSPRELAGKSGQSLPRVRSGLRELKNAGFVEETEGKYKLSESGAALLRIEGTDPLTPSF